MKQDELFLWHVGDPDRPALVGQLRLVESGKGVSLRYANAWIESGFPISDDLPLIDIEHLPRGRLQADSPRAVGAVDDARPDRWGERVIRYVDKPARLSLMEYLFYAGDDRFGALGVSTSDAQYLPHGGQPLPRYEMAQTVSEIVAKVEASQPLTAAEQKILAAGGSLGGAQPKALMEIDGDEWVVKFPRRDAPLDSPLIEHASMTLARKAGIRSADTLAVPLKQGHAVAVRRFDRNGKQRIHSISAATALRAVAPGNQDPDFSYPALALLLRRLGVADQGANDADSRELFRRMVFNILMDNTDDHEKNHALLVVSPRANGRYRLSPAYDVLPSAAAHGYQEFACGEDGHDSTLKNAMSQCRAFGLSPLEAAQEVEQVIAAVDGWREHFRACGVTEADMASIAQHVDGSELRVQREQFSAQAYEAAGAKASARRLKRSS
ncbi:MAG TPA: HipA domain-containing protein [Roseateles sp.]